MYKKSAYGWLGFIDFFIIDLLCLGLAFITACWLRNGLINPWKSGIYSILFIFFMLTDIIIMGYPGTLKNVRKRGYYTEFLKTLRQVCLVMLSTTFLLFIAHTGSSYSRAVILLTGGLYLVLSYLSRIIWKKVILSSDFFLDEIRSLLIIAPLDDLNDIISEVQKNNYGCFRIAGIALTDTDMTGMQINGVPVVATMDTAAEYVCREWIDEVFIKLSPEMQFCDKLIRQFLEMGVTIHQSLITAVDTTGQKQIVEHLGAYTVLTTSINIMSAEASLMKRMVDIIGGLAGCLITGILFLLVAPSIYLKSPGPVFFAQNRVGKNGKKFKLYKFRSMCLDAEEQKMGLLEQNRVDGGMMFKIEWDPRIIGSEKGPGKGIGNFIRKYSIDEFPQFWNVLKGDMSLVGTRPPTLDEWDKYSAHHRVRMAIKPGITGIWQVSGRSNVTDFEEVVKLDLNYIMNWNIWLDCKILMKTVKVVFGKSGAM